MSPEYYIGLISGTSMDAVDCALVEFVNGMPKVHDFQCFEIPTTLKARLSALIDNQGLSFSEFGSADIQVARLFSDAANAIIKKNEVDAAAIRAIGSHGQTVWHQPVAEASGCPFTIQIGDPNTIAHLTNISTVADFRRHDMAAGGQGAPLVPAFHDAIFGRADVPRVVLNLGGFANITVLDAGDGKPFGYDTGPANVLLDSWIKHCTGHDYDDQGTWSLSGTPATPLLERLMTEPYFSLPHPKSTGRELFNLAWVQRQLANLSTRYKPEDVQATLRELSAQTIADQILRHLKKGEILVCGGGFHNTALLQSLGTRLPTFTLVSTERYGLHPDWVEAVAFAWFARQTLQGKPIDFSPFTGASKAVIAGGIYQA
ncbi:MAG TPA: anhydro-N-acetylmuramic acid kinase [Candidatus Acidoferrum sp.]|nr:anhydro-N-acetylmuramic acid kinase [Candidatus Acidoferrum sp.]